MSESNQSTILSGHVSPETAYLVNDYPYGFRLRCKIRYWLEYKPGKGMRFVSQTTNPKRPGIVWNAPKASTYRAHGAVMLVNPENGHVGCTGLGDYDNIEVCVNWRNKYAQAMPEAAQIALKAWITAKLEYERRKVNGDISMTRTFSDFANITNPAAEPTVRRETTLLKSDYTAAQLAAFGETLRTPVTDALGQLNHCEEAAL